MADYEDIDHDKLQQKLTAEELATWISAPAAVRQAIDTYGSDYKLAVNTLHGRLVAGLIRAGADHVTLDRMNDAPHGPIEISAGHWNFMLTPDQYTEFWKTGDLLLLVPTKADIQLAAFGQKPIGSGETFARYFGVRFERSAVERLLAAKASGPTPTRPPRADAPAAPPKHAGGRPRYDWWEDVWAGIAARLEKGWKPVKQAEIEAEMKSLAENYEPDVADSTIRIRASKLAKVLNLKAEN